MTNYKRREIKKVTSCLESNLNVIIVINRTFFKPCDFDLFELNDFFVTESPRSGRSDLIASLKKMLAMMY